MLKREKKKATQTQTHHLHSLALSQRFLSEPMLQQQENNNKKKKKGLKENNRRGLEINIPKLCWEVKTDTSEEQPSSQS